MVNVTKRTKKDFKKGTKTYVKKEKIKKQQYGCERYKNLSQDEK